MVGSDSTTEDCGQFIEDPEEQRLENDALDAALAVEGLCAEMCRALDRLLMTERRLARHRAHRGGAAA